MRRLLLILMLLIMPFQASWGAASVYCSHESGAAAQHFGHHSHQHKAEADDSKDTKPLSVVDADCAFCQFSNAGMFAFPAHAIPMISPQTQSPSLGADSFAVIRPERPERPNWDRAA